MWETVATLICAFSYYEALEKQHCVRLVDNLTCLFIESNKNASLEAVNQIFCVCVYVTKCVRYWKGREAPQVSPRELNCFDAP